jgi:murein L,D-transpeptidase YafK
VGYSLIRSIGSLSLLVALTAVGAAGIHPASGQEQIDGPERGAPLGSVPRPPEASSAQDGVDRAQAEEQRVLPKLLTELREGGFQYGAPILIRIFKLDQKLEVWLMDGYEYRLFHTYSICNFSGTLGPKVKEGDLQAPEGFYYVGEQQLNPNSDFHLSFDLGYPNAYDRVHGRTGSHLMIHGGCLSTGCFAMTDQGITEIYTLVSAALKSGQTLFEVHIFPFRMTPANMAAHSKSRWAKFWANLKEGYDYFELYRRPPVIDLKARNYSFGPFVTAASAETSSSVAENCTRC